MLNAWGVEQKAKSNFYLTYWKEFLTPEVSVIAPENEEGTHT